MTPSTFVSTMLTRSASELSSKVLYLYPLLPALLILEVQNRVSVIYGNLYYTAYTLWLYPYQRSTVP